MANPNPTPRFAPGNQHGGRTKGARARLSDKFFTTLQADFEQHADEVFASLRENDLGTYANLVARLMPKELEARLQVEQRLPGNLDSESYAQLRRVVELIDRLAPDVDPLEVFGVLERALIASYAPSAPEPLAITHQRALPAPMVNAEAVIMPPLPYRLQNS